MLSFFSVVVGEMFNRILNCFSGFTTLMVFPRYKIRSRSRFSFHYLSLRKTEDRIYVVNVTTSKFSLTLSVPYVFQYKDECSDFKVSRYCL